MFRRVRIAFIALALLATCFRFGSSASAQADEGIPENLPRYEFQAVLDIKDLKLAAHEKVTYTNRTPVVQPEIAFHVYPKFKVPADGKLKLAKTLEVLRLGPDEAIDPKGDRISIDKITVGGMPAEYRFQGEDGTVMMVPLAEPLAPGETVTIEITFVIDIPTQWGRWSHHRGITTLVNWYPILTVPNDDGTWNQEPFVPWHQPWHQETGWYRMELVLPADQVVASTGRIVERVEQPDDHVKLTIEGPPSRDFAIVCSNRFQVVERQVGRVTARVLTEEKHDGNARRALDYMAEVLPLYEDWFGPFPYDEMEVVTSFFGWNGNECSGLVMIDDRVFNMPAAGERYLDHLITHEVAHQWWWNVVGTNGYAETFMDEGLVNSITARRLDMKYGRNAPLIVWPNGFDWMPTIGREDLRMASYYKWKARGNGGPVIQDLKSMSNLQALFSLAYDRGGKVVDMIANRMGDDRFFDFLRHLYRTYAFRILHYEELKAELERFDPEGAWPARLDAWLIQEADTDWAIEKVDVTALPKFEPAAPADAMTHRATIEIVQNESLDEPTEIGVIAGGSVVSIPILPDADAYDIPGGRVEKIPAEVDGHPIYRVVVDLPAEPTQIEIDPDHRLLDTKPSNNVWREQWRWRLTPAVTPVDTSEMFQAYDRPSVILGPFVDQNARGGLKLGYFAPNKGSIDGFIGAMPSLDRVIVGGEAKLTYLFGSSWNAGIFFEDGINPNWSTTAAQTQRGGRVYMRNVLLESSSVLDDDAIFYEFFAGHGNIFWEGDVGRPTPGMLNALGFRFKLNTQAPFWDPAEGRLVQVDAEVGMPAYEAGYDNYTRWQVYLGEVWTLGDSFGPLENTRFAVRGLGGMAWPQDVNFFRLGSGQMHRALGFNSQNGSAYWLATAEWRFPIVGQFGQSVFDRALSFDKISGVLFYDVGETALSRQLRPVVHGVGFGLRVDTVLFGFLERVNLRFDVAQPVYGAKGGPVFWFGFNQVF